MATILLIETSSRNCSVALSRNGEVIQQIEEASEQYVHAEKLHPFIDTLLKETQTDIRSLDAVCVSKGPGSYTGLRIGVSAAKGLCFSLNIPLIAIDTTFALAAYGRKNFPDAKYFLPMIDARRMEVYCALYDTSLETVEEVSARIVEKEFFKKTDFAATVFIGDGVEKCSPLMPDNTVLLPCIPAASMMAETALQKFLDKSFENTAYFEPFYLKDFIAGIPKKAVL